MQGHPDKITIYCGKEKSGTIIFQRILTDTVGSPVNISFDAKKCAGFITVIIEPEPTKNSADSHWNFEISCPD